MKLKARYVCVCTKIFLLYSIEAVPFLFSNLGSWLEVSVSRAPIRLRLHEQITHALFAQIRPELLHTDREFEQLKEVLFAHVNAAL